MEIIAHILCMSRKKGKAVKYGEKILSKSESEMTSTGSVPTL